MSPRLLGALAASFLTLTVVPSQAITVAAGSSASGRSHVRVSERGVMPAAQKVPAGGFRVPAAGGTQREPRLHPHQGATSAPGAVRVATAAASNQPVQTAGPFNFLTQQSSMPISNQIYAPPDTQVAAGPGYLLEVVNAEGAVFTTAGVQVGTTFSLQSLFPLESGFSYTDPRVAYDPSGHWYVTILEFKAGTTFASRVYLATSSNANPNPSIIGSWKWARVWPTTTPDPIADSQLCDQPQLGWSADKITMSCNNFSPPSSFAGAETRVIDKLDFLSPGSPIVYQDLESDPSTASLSPAETYGKTTVQYLINNAQTTPANVAGVITVTGRPDSTAGISAYQSLLSIRASTLPPPADQQGTSEQLDTGDNRFQGSTWRSGILWTGGNNGCTPSGDTAVRSCVRLVAVDTGTMTVEQDFDVGAAGLHLMYPGVTTDGWNDMFASFTVSGTTQFPSVEYTSQAVGEAAGSVDGIHMIAAGQAFYTDSLALDPTNPHLHRWGDYGAATPDPTDGSNVWLAGEYVPTTANFWGTAGGEATLHPPCVSGSVSATAASPMPLGAPVTFTATAGGCVGTAEYSFWLFGRINGTLQWLNVQPYSPTNTYVMNYAGLGYGTYSVDVWMRNQGSAVQYETFGLMAWVIGGCNYATTTITSGTTYTTTAGGVACTNPEFKVWMVGKGLSWTLERDWSSNPSFDVSTVPGLGPGTYSVDVWVRQQGVSSNTGYYETWGLAAYVKGNSAACASSPVSTTAAPPSPQSTATSVMFNTTGCGASAQYEYWLFPGKGGAWQQLRGYGGGAYTWNTAGLAAGNYSVVAWAKQAVSTTPDYDSYGLYSDEINGATTATLITSLPSPQPQSAGAITLTASSTGASTPEYAFWVLPSGGTSYQSIQAYSTASTAMWTPPARGTYALVLWVRQKGGGTPDSAYESYALLSFSSTQ